MRKYVKQPLEIQEQIAVLKERGLIFLQEENAINKLKQVSYFRQGGRSVRRVAGLLPPVVN